MIRGLGRVTIEELPDDVLLDIFEFYLSEPLPWYRRRTCQWYPLVHVCQRWRYLVFASPLRLDLRLICTDSSPVREKLDIWPPLLIKILPRGSITHGDNIYAALEHPNRIREICLWIIHPLLDRLVTMMQKPFPELESLFLVTYDEPVPVFPNTFLGGSASRLRSLTLSGIPFPTLPKLLLSSNCLVDLSFDRIPQSGYISPETMAGSLSGLTRLKSFSIGFKSSVSFPDRRPPPPTRAVLPVLTQFQFCGPNEYLEDLLARINAPLLHTSCIALFNQPVFGTQQLTQFIGHAPMFMSYNEAEIDFMSDAVSIICSSIEQYSGYLKLDIPSNEGDLQVPSMTQICSRFSFLMSRIERLYIQARHRLPFRVEMDDTHWLELFRPFTAVQALYLPLQVWTLIMHRLSEESVTDALPALVDLYLEGYQAPGSELPDIEPFITARQHSGHPVVVRCWDRL
ncbi:hypothetical protein BGW80DRAFT_1251610 [Lactifluus volemus]|nr:hypothetical protein BGW80DRAFT_1251610 [Lactifluus volemus]